MMEPVYQPTIDAFEEERLLAVMSGIATIAIGLATVHTALNVPGLVGAIRGAGSEALPVGPEHLPSWPGMPGGPLDGR